MGQPHKHAEWNNIKLHETPRWRIDDEYRVKNVYDFALELKEALYLKV